LVFDEGRHLERRASARAAGLLPLLERLASPPSGAPPTAAGGAGGYPSLTDAAHHLLRLARPGSLVAVISDFRAVERDSGRWMAELGARGEVLLIPVYDPIERHAPPAGCYPITDGGRRCLLDLMGARARRLYEDGFEARLSLLHRLARQHRAHLLELTSEVPVGPALAQGLGARTRISGGRVGTP
jgi:hypothetical protein